MTDGHVSSVIMPNSQEASGSASLVCKDEELPSEAMARSVYICKEQILRQALGSLSLDISESRTCIIGNDEIVGSICIDAPSHGQYSILHNKKIFGEYKSNKEEALESASLATLLYLQKIGVISIDDVNQTNLTECEARLVACQQRLVAASDWANIFQERADTLKGKLDIAYKENEILAHINKSFGIKKEEPPYQTAAHEKTIPIKTPPPPDYGTADSEKHPCTGADVKRSLFKTHVRADCKEQKYPNAPPCPATQVITGGTSTSEVQQVYEHTFGSNDMDVEPEAAIQLLSTPTPTLLPHTSTEGTSTRSTNMRMKPVTWMLNQKQLYNLCLCLYHMGKCLQHTLRATHLLPLKKPRPSPP